MRIAFQIVLIFHALIHLLGFVKAFNLTSISQLTQNISRTHGIFWLSSALLFAISCLLILLKKDSWWIPAAVGLIISQYLIFTSWHDAKFGTIVNSVVLIATIVGGANWNFSRTFRNEIVKGLQTTHTILDSVLTENDILEMPEPVKKYLRYTGALNNNRVKNFSAVFQGQFRQKGSEWMNFTSDQNNFLNEPTRLFFMKAVMKGLPVSGFHCYKNAKAFMDIRLLSMFRVEYQDGNEMNTGETVTFFNDMCVMAPGFLVDNRIKWQNVEGNKVKATFTNKGITISAWLYFNDTGELINFVSDDRPALGENHSLQKARWSTPLKNYKQINGLRLATYGETIYTFPEGDFCYGKFNLKSIRYNNER